MLRKIRVLVAKPGLDGHDRGAKVMASALRDNGAEIIYTGLRQSPQQIVTAALQEDVSVIGLSILSGAHIHLCKELMRLLKEKNCEDISVIVGGIVPEEDVEILLGLGVKKVFGPGTFTKEIVDFIKSIIRD